MKPYILIFFLIGYSYGLSSQEQKTIDSLRLTIKNTADLTSKSVIENQLAEYYHTNGQYEHAEKTIASSLNHAKYGNNPEVLAKAYLILGQIHYTTWKSSLALKNFLKVDSILSTNTIVNNDLYNAKTSIGHVFMRLIEDSNDYKSFKKVAVYYKEALAIAQNLMDSTSQGYIYIRLGHVESAQNNHHEALMLFKKAANFIKKGDDIEKDLFYGLAMGYLNTGQKDLATEFMMKYFEIRKNSGIKSQVAIGHWSLGNFYYKIEDYEKAILHEKKSAELFEQLESIDYGRLSSVNKILYESYRNKGDFKNAFNYLVQHKVMNDSANSISRRNVINEVEIKYQTEKKEQEIALLSSQKALIEQQKKSQRNILIGGLGLTSLAGLFIFTLFRNRTKRNNKLRELDALKSNFFTNITHEFRTPLTLISSPIQEILAEPDLSPEKRSHFEMASRNTERLLSLVDQLLDLSKIDSGNRALQLENGKITQLIAAWSDSFSYLAKQKAIALDIDIKDKETEVWFDKDALEKIVVNLLGNAIKYTPTKGQIKVKASIENNFLNLDIMNTGQGLTKDEIDNIFNRFHQTNEQNEGVGIGLSLVKELTALHGGTISVKSEKDTWTTFEVSIFIDKSQFKNAVLKKPSATHEKVPSMVLNPNINIESEPLIENGMPILLIVEDNADVRVLLSDTFKSDFQVITAKNGAEGIELALEHIPDLIVSDVMMPVKDGVELTKTLKEDERTSHIPIVLLTAKAGDDNELIGLNVGADDYITKPFNKKLLLSKANGLIVLRKKLQLRYSQEVILRPKDIAISSVDERFLEKVQRVLDEKLIESNFNSEAFSKAVHMSRMQLHRKLKALTGLTTSEFVRSQRLKLATHLLKQSQINISEVGYAVGFNDHAYFTKCFRETYHCTPSEFIKKG